MGDAGEGTGPHVHLEVYEYFPEDSVPQTYDLDNGKPGHFDRVNPLSVFPPRFYTLGNDDTTALINYGETTDQQGSQQKVLSGYDVKNDFVPWPGPTTP